MDPPRSRVGQINWNNPFSTLATTHALGLAGDALLAFALASSLFFQVDPSEGRQKVLLGLLFTMAPFAVVSPLIGPVMDRVRGGHRAIIVASMGARAVLGLLLAWSIATDRWSLFPTAFAMLVAGKTYQVARAAVVPTVVSGDHELIEANSKLQILGAVAGAAAAVPGAILFLLGAAPVAVAASGVFGCATAASLRIPARRVASRPPEAEEVAELRGGGILLAATAMAVLRGIVGFVTLLVAFELRGGVDPGPLETLARNVGRQAALLPRTRVLPPEVPPKWYFALIVPLGVLGSLVGAALAPRLRSHVSLERILAGAVALAALGGLMAVLTGGLLGYVSLALLVAVGASGGKQAFDSIVQRDAPDANRGRSFARFEARFQVVWVLGAAIPTALHLPFGLGAAAVALVASGTVVCYVLGRFPQVSRSGKSGISASGGSSGSG